MLPCVEELYVCTATEITWMLLESITSSGQMKSPYRLIIFITVMVARIGLASGTAIL